MVKKILLTLLSIFPMWTYTVHAQDDAPKSPEEKDQCLQSCIVGSERACSQFGDYDMQGCLANVNSNCQSECN